MQKASLSASSYVVFGLLALHGPATSYELMRRVETSVGHFWAFPRSQLYAEPDRLVRYGYLTEKRERDGRRRRVFALTKGGRAALEAWLGSPTREHIELRDPGLLKLFFMPLVGEEDVVALAREQAALHRQRLDEFERIAAELTTEYGPFPHATPLHMGLLYERMCQDFWEQFIGRTRTVD